MLWGVTINYSIQATWHWRYISCCMIQSNLRLCDDFAMTMIQHNLGYLALTLPTCSMVHSKPISRANVAMVVVWNFQVRFCEVWQLHLIQATPRVRLDESKQFLYNCIWATFQHLLINKRALKLLSSWCSHLFHSDSLRLSQILSDSRRFSQSLSDCFRFSQILWLKIPHFFLNFYLSS